MLMQLGPNNTTVVVISGLGILTVNNTTEKLVNSTAISLINPSNGTALGDPSSLVETYGGDLIYTAHRSVGEVGVVNVGAGTVSTISVPSVRRLALSPNNFTLLAFSDDVDSFTAIQTSTKTATTLCGPAAPCPGLSRPTFAVFSDDSKTAYVLGCGAECGGTTASLAVFDMTQNPPVQGKTIALGNAADMAISYNGKLYISGTDPAVDPNTGAAANIGRLNVVDLTAQALANPGSGPIPIGNGFHTLMSVGSNNKLFIGAQTCSTGCLSIVDISANTSVESPSRQGVTGIAPIAGRNVAYVSEDGALHIYDTTTSQQSAHSGQVNITGIVTGVVAP